MGIILHLPFKVTTSNIRMNKLILISFCVLGLAAMVTAQIELQEAAAPSGENCFCQCSDLTFQDKYGREQGNCKRADHTGARWCYVDPRYSQCRDLQRSKRFGDRWSYQACATPGLDSYICNKGIQKYVQSGRSDTLNSEIADVGSEIADVNGDGAIDRNEFNWAFPNVDLYEEFGKLDTNNDGFIDETEGRGILFNKLIKGAKKLFNKFVGSIKSYQ